MRIDKEKLKKIKFLPDPLLQEDGHYLPFSQAFASGTTEKDRPSLKGKTPAEVLSFSPSVQHAKNTGIMMQCDECSSWRPVFSKKKLSSPQQSTLQSILEDVSYTCSVSMEDLDCLKNYHPLLSVITFFFVLTQTYYSSLLYLARTTCILCTHTHFWLVVQWSMCAVICG